MSFLTAIVGGGAGSIGKHKEAMAQVYQYTAEAEALEISAQNAEEQEAYARETAGIVESQARAKAAQTERANRLRLGSIRAAAGASGGRAYSGSIIDILSDVAGQGELDRQNVLFEGELNKRSALEEARGYAKTALLDRKRAEGYRLAARGAKNAGTLGVISSMFSIGGSLLGSGGSS